MTGVTTSAPARSPSHQVSQIEPKLDQSAKPASARLRDADGGAQRGRQEAQQREPGDAGRRLESVAAVRPAVDQPGPDHAFERVAGADGGGVASEPAVVTLAAKAATRIAGQTR